METYKRKQNDIKYRIVSLESADLKSPRDFAEDDQEISLPKNNEVLEIIHMDGSSKIVTSMKPRTVHYQIIGNEVVLLNDCPRGRIWIRKKTDTEMLYKCPAEWKKKNNANWFCFVGDTAEMELIGDKYINAIYTFSRG